MLTRRQAIRSTIIGAAGCLLPTERTIARAAQSFWDNPRSPATTPFITKLPAVGAVDGRRRSGQRDVYETDAFADLDDYCTPFVETNSTRFFEIVAEERVVSLHPQLGPTTVWGYRPAGVPQGQWPFMFGPVFKMRIGGRTGEGSIVRFKNQLPHQPRPFGVPMLTTHLHGGHHPARADGFSTNLDGFAPFVFGPGEHFDYCFPLVDVGVLSNVAEPTERTSTMWYHDHLIDHTGPNVYRGLAGMFLVFDELDADDETNWDPGLGLPSGAFDVPLALQDRVFNKAGQLMYDPLDHDGFLGDKMLVNGVIQPYLDVTQRKYRLRFLNGANARFFQLAISKQDGTSCPFDMIATEGGLLARTIRGVRSFLLANAERIEVVIDFSAFNEGDVLYLENRAVQDNGRGPDEFLKRGGTRLLKFIVGEQADDPSRVPDALRPFAPVSTARLAAAKRRTFEFERRHGAWVINGELAGQLDRPLARPRANTPEIWRLVNKSGGWWHPVHVHSELGRVIRRNGRTPLLHERDGLAKKDTYVLGPNESVDVCFDFRDYPGPFQFHCHNIEHEDRAMMARFDVV
jgi:FtsP/CotA-like multicopper oxidase with cupredoxin domain